jgi:archaellum biogenesis ATPase FlaH
MNLMVVIPGDKFMAKIIEVLKSVYSENEKICYITLNKPYKSLAVTFQNNMLDPGRVYFIDAITQTIFKPDDAWNCTYVSSPRSFDELLQATKAELEDHKFDVVVLDSISTMLVYENQEKVTGMMHSLSTLVSTAGCEGVFVCLAEDMSNEFVKKLEMFVDKVVDIGA